MPGSPDWASRELANRTPPPNRAALFHYLQVGWDSALQVSVSSSTRALEFKASCKCGAPFFRTAIGVSNLLSLVCGPRLAGHTFRKFAKGIWFNTSRIQTDMFFLRATSEGLLLCTSLKICKLARSAYDIRSSMLNSFL